MTQPTRLKLLFSAVVVLVALGACSGGTPPSSEVRSTITVPISLYVVIDNREASDPFVSSVRTEDDLRAMLAKMNQIWEPAGIVLEEEIITTIGVPEGRIAAVMSGDYRTFFDGINRDFIIPRPGTLTGFYLRLIGGPNGISFASVRTFFVMDEPSVHDERVSSHEVGHLLGLHHTREDVGRLLFSGTNGMALTEEEIAVARYAAQGLLDGVR